MKNLLGDNPKDYWSNEIKSMEAPHAGMPCPNIGTPKGQPIRPNVLLMTSQKNLDNFKKLLES